MKLTIRNIAMLKLITENNKNNRIICKSMTESQLKKKIIQKSREKEKTTKHKNYNNNDFI